MGWQGFLYLAVTAGMFTIFAAIVAYVCGRKRRERLESPKHRMLDDE